MFNVTMSQRLRHKAGGRQAVVRLESQVQFTERSMSDRTRALEASYPAYLEAHSVRYARALQATGYTSALVHSGSQRYAFEDDLSYPFKVNAPFKTWAPITDNPDCFIYFEPGKPPLLLFHSPQDFWHKNADLPNAYWTPHFEIRAIEERNDARALLPQDLSRTAFIGDPFPELSSWGVGGVNPKPLKSRLDYERAVKLPYELHCMREANRLGASGHRAAAIAFARGASEFEVELAFLRGCGQREHELPYNPIIALNEGGAILHYQVLQREPPAQHRSMLIDAGAQFAGYPSDITRTYARNDADFTALIASMEDMQLALCASVKAGVDWRDIHLAAHQLTAELLHDADIITCDVREAIESRVSSVFLPHGLGHLLGLQVHDVGGFQANAAGDVIPKPEGHPYLRLTRVLEEGFVVTMEPGIYFIEQLLEQARADGRGKHINWTRVEQFKPFGGIRIEDNLAVTATGCENLTRDAFAANLREPGDA